KHSRGKGEGDFSLEDGEVIALDGVLASNVDPRHLALDLLGEAQVGETIAGKIKRYDWGQSFFGIYVALDRPVPYRAGQDADRAGYVQSAARLSTTSPRRLLKPAPGFCRRA